MYLHLNSSGEKMITITKKTIYKWGWQAGTGKVRYTYLDTTNMKVRQAFVSDRICYHFDRTRKRVNPHNNPNIVIEPFIYFMVNNRQYRTSF